MLKQLDKLWISHLLFSFLTVLTALLVIDFLGKVFDEMGDVGEKGYELTTMLIYSISLVPARIPTFFPMSFLVGALVALGRLALSSELTVMQVSGYSRSRIAIVGIIVAIIVGFGTLALSEFIAQPLKHFAESYRLTKRGLSTKELSEGFWAKDNETIIRVTGVKSNGRLAYVRQYRQSKNSKEGIFDTIVDAQEAEFGKDGWILHNVTIRQFTELKVKQFFVQSQFWPTRLAPEIASIIASKPEDLSLKELRAFSQYQRANGIDSQRHQVLLLSRLFLPLTGAVMLILALPFSFSHARSSSLGRKIAIGMGFGLVYFVIADSITNIVMLTGMPALTGALTPIIIFSLIGASALILKR